MKEHLSCCSGKAGFTSSFDNGKVIDYQDHCNNLGDMPFSMYFDFETTTGNVVFFDAIRFVLDFIFFDDPEIFNKNTLKQLEAAALSVKQKEKNTALAEMFSVELKFTIDCLKSWFQKNHKISEIDIDQKLEFIRKNPVKKDSLCCLCDFPIDPKVENGWLDHVIKAEYLFLENIYSDEEMKKMKIEKLELFEKNK